MTIRIRKNNWRKIHNNLIQILSSILIQSPITIMFLYIHSSPSPSSLFSSSQPGQYPLINSPPPIWTDLRYLLLYQASNEGHKGGSSKNPMTTMRTRKKWRGLPPRRKWLPLSPPLPTKFLSLSLSDHSDTQR